MFFTLKGLAYVDFSDDEHLAGAIAKNKQTLHGKQLSIARSNPKHGKGEKSGQNVQKKHGMPSGFVLPFCVLSDLQACELVREAVVCACRFIGSYMSWILIRIESITN